MESYPIIQIDHYLFLAGEKSVGDANAGLFPFVLKPCSAVTMR